MAQSLPWVFYGDGGDSISCARGFMGARGLFGLRGRIFMLFERRYIKAAKKSYYSFVMPKGCGQGVGFYFGGGVVSESSFVMALDCQCFFYFYYGVSSN